MRLMVLLLSDFLRHVFFVLRLNFQVLVVKTSQLIHVWKENMKFFAQINFQHLFRLACLGRMSAFK